MQKSVFNLDQLITVAQITPEDLTQVNLCRRLYNRLGFGYQLSFVKLFNRFPSQQPFEILSDILNYASAQLGIPEKEIHSYYQRRETVAEHQERIRKHLGILRFDESSEPVLREFLFREACRLEQTNALMAKAEQLLRERRILQPSRDTLQRLIGSQRKSAREFIFKKITDSISPEIKGKLDFLLDTRGKRLSELHFLKQPPGRPSGGSMLKLIERMETIQATGVLNLDLCWLSNNFQRFLSRYTKRCDAKRLRELEDEHRYAALICFLVQTFKDTVDFMVDMYDKLINRIYNHVRKEVHEHDKSHRKKIRESLRTFKDLAELILDQTVEDSTLRYELFKRIGKEELSIKIEEVNLWLTGKHSHVFNLIKDRFSYIRQFSPALIKHLHLQEETGMNCSLVEAVEILRELNEKGKRKLPDNPPLDFLPAKIRPFVEINGEVDKHAWECALLIVIRDEIKSGNVSVRNSKRFGRFGDFFIPLEKWNEMRESFFQRAGLPSNPNNVREYLENRLNTVFDRFLNNFPDNSYVSVGDNGWHCSTDPHEKLDTESETLLGCLKEWLETNMRVVKLPELLIEVDNELKITRFFMSAAQQENLKADEICAVLATVMAHGCNIGTYTMSQIIEGISYHRMKHISDWMMTEDTQRAALAVVVNAISQLDISQTWGAGKTSSSDGQRYALRRKVLQQTYSPKFNDFALEFYSFIADNYAPYYSLPIECTDRDASFVLDGILYNESDLPLEEHFVDTHGYTENNFAAFVMLGKKFSPRIRALHKQRIYRIDTKKEYHILSPLVSKPDRTIHMEWIEEQWDRLGHFYASLEYGHTTASTAMRRLNGFTGKNHFYRANRELGRVLKTEHILQYMSDTTLRRKIRRGLLKGEQLHALARDLNYGKRGRITSGNLQEQRTSCSCLTLILACIVYWQAKEINRVILECNPEGNNIDLGLIEHISPITWENVILYGEYVLNRDLIKI